MKRSFAGVLLLLLFLSTITVKAAEPRYVGVKKCKQCHNKKSKGQIYHNWKRSRHAQAFWSLQEQSAKHKAETMGVADAPWQAPKCLLCHGVDPRMPTSRFSKRFQPENGVQCETCHGAGSLYAKKRVMIRIASESKKGLSTTAVKTGLRFVEKSACGSRCHTAEFSFEGQVLKNPCYSRIRHARTILNNMLEPFH